MLATVFLVRCRFDDVGFSYPWTLFLILINLVSTAELGTRNVNTNMYQFFHLWKFREYFREEIRTSECKFEDDFERKIDSICMCFFLGNEILSNIRFLIYPKELLTYSRQFAKKLVGLEEYLTESGSSNLKDLFKLLVLTKMRYLREDLWNINQIWRN